MHKKSSRQHGGRNEAKPGGGGPETGEPAADGGGLEDLIRNEANPLGHLLIADGEEGGLGGKQAVELGGARAQAFRCARTSPVWAGVNSSNR